MPDRPKLVPNEHENRPTVAASGGQYATDATKVMENHTALAEAIGNVLVDGRDCAEGTVNYGSSTTTQCCITLPDDRVEVGDLLHFGDGSREWVFVVAYDREIKITDAELIVGTAGTNDYNTIKDDLHIRTISKDKLTKPVTRDLVQLAKVTSGRPNSALTADVIQMTEADADKVGTRLTELETDFAIGHDAAGAHKDDVIDQDNIAEDGCYKNGFMSALKNGFFVNYPCATTSNNLPDGWDLMGSPTPYVYGGDFEHGGKYWVITAGATGHGMQQTIDEFFDYADEFDFECWLRGDSASGSLTVAIYDGVATSTENAIITTTWTRVKVHHTLDPSATGITVRVYSEAPGAFVFRVARCVGTWGNFRKLLHQDVRSQVHQKRHEVSFYIETVPVGAYVVKGQFAAPTRAWRIWAVSAYCITAPVGNYAYFRIYDGTTEAVCSVMAVNNIGTWRYDGTPIDTDLKKWAMSSDYYYIEARQVSGTGPSGCTVTIEYTEIDE